MLRPSTQSLRLFLTISLVALTTLGCTSVPTFDARPGSTGEEAQALLEASIEAHGGDVYQQLDNIAVSYDGRWGRAIQRIQPVITDTGYRKSSEERLLLDDGRLIQRHQGPEGVKTVERTDEGVEVVYFPNEGTSRPADDEEHAAAALVADAYEMFLLGPSFLLEHSAEMQALSPERLDGRTYDRVLVRLVPGLGESEEDRVLAWIDRQNRQLYRVLFTLDGTASTQGAAVDVTFYDHREHGGILWPTRFFERVRAPLRLFAHEWTVTGLDLDRPTQALDQPEAIRELAERPAEPLTVDTFTTDR